MRSGLVHALGLTLGLALLLGSASAEDPSGSSEGDGFISDPSVGTLPMQGDPGAPDQAISLRGSTEAIRGVLRSLRPIDDGDVTAWQETVALPDGTVWVRIYGDVEIALDVDALPSVELGVFSGFEGGGMAYVAQTSAGLVRGDDMHAGEELELDAYRLLTAGLLDCPVRLHCVHGTGLRASVGLVWDPGAGTFLLRQDV